MCLEKHSTHEILTVLTRTKLGLTERFRQLPVRSCKSIDYYQNLLENFHTVQTYVKFKPHKQFGNHIKKCSRLEKKQGQLLKKRRLTLNKLWKFGRRIVKTLCTYFQFNSIKCIIYFQYNSAKIVSFSFYFPLSFIQLGSCSSQPFVGSIQNELNDFL